jgi:hypothetical protein
MATKTADFALVDVKTEKRLGVHFDSSTITSLKNGDKKVVAGVSQDDLYNALRSSTMECFEKSYIEVTEVMAPPPYGREALQKSGLDSILVVSLQKTKFMPPIIVAAEGYRGSVSLDYNLYDGTGTALRTGSVEGKAFDRSLVLRFGSGKIFSKVCVNAVRDAILKIRDGIGG